MSTKLTIKMAGVEPATSSDLERLNAHFNEARLLGVLNTRVTRITTFAM